MKIRLTILCVTLFCSLSAISQGSSSTGDSSINNLVLPKGYAASEYGALPEYKKSGKGSITMILIPGWGFDASVFDDFIKANKKNYTMYVITIPGYGKTKAPPMPPAGTSYKDQTWNKGVELGIIKLMEKEKIDKPVIVGHATQGTQVALRMAMDYPDKVGSVIILGGHAKFVAVVRGKPANYPLDTMVKYTDSYTGPVWFKHMKQNYFNDNNYAPEVYSLDSARGAVLWAQPASVPTPVMVRYICEFFASDIRIGTEKIKCPVLILRALFNEEVLNNPVNNYVKAQFIDAWKDVLAKNTLIQMRDIKDAATFVWKDNPADVYKEIKEFLHKNE